MPSESSKADNQLASEKGILSAEFCHNDDD